MFDENRILELHELDRSSPAHQETVCTHIKEEPVHDLNVVRESEQPAPIACSVTNTSSTEVPVAVLNTANSQASQSDADSRRANRSRLLEALSVPLDSVLCCEPCVVETRLLNHTVETVPSVPSTTTCEPCVVGTLSGVEGQEAFVIPYNCHTGEQEVTAIYADNTIENC